MSGTRALAEPAKPRRGLLLAALVILISYYLFRIGLTVIELTQGIPLDREPYPWVRPFLDVSEALVGVVGLVGVPGLYLTKRWGWWATLVASVYAIAFDAWAAVAVQTSAAGGVIPPAVVLLLLLVYRRRFFLEKAEPAPNAAAHS